MTSRRFLVGGLLVALLLAGVASHYASTRPDGLQRVAERAGFATTGRESDGPLAGYEVAGVEDERLAGGLAGVVGVLVTLGLTGGLVLAVRRRRGGQDAT